MTRQGLPTATRFAGKSRNDHACANLSATVVRYEILPGVSLAIVTCAMSNTSFKSSLVSAFHGLVLGYENLNDHDHLRQW